MGLAGGGFAVLCNGAALEGPDGGVLRCATRELACAVAEEWRQAGARTLTSLVGRSQRIEAAPDRTLAALLGFARSDLLCHRAADPPRLAAMQATQWQPWLDWLRDRHGVALPVTCGVMPLVLQATAFETLREVLQELPARVLAGLDLAVPALGSLVLGLALAERQIEAAQAVTLSRLEAIFQHAIWGEDPVSSAHAAHLTEQIIQTDYFMRLTEPAFGSADPC